MAMRKNSSKYELKYVRKCSKSKLQNITFLPVIMITICYVIQPDSHYIENVSIKEIRFPSEDYNTWPLR